MANYKQLCAELVHIADALDSGAALASNQGQAMDGYSALAAFRDVAYRARAMAGFDPDNIKTELSLAAQAVLAAAGDSEPGIHNTIAAALHAAAYQLLAVQWKGQIPVDGAQQIGINWARDALHVLANELEAQ